MVKIIIRPTSSSPITTIILNLLLCPKISLPLFLSPSYFRPPFLIFSLFFFTTSHFSAFSLHFSLLSGCFLSPSFNLSSAVLILCESLLHELGVSGYTGSFV